MRTLTKFFLAAAMLVPLAAQASGWHSYRNAQMGFAMSNPDGWRVDTSHIYTAMGPGKDIHGVAFKVRKSFTTGTNLSDDSYFAVEILPGVEQCRAALFLDDAIGKPRIESGNNGLQWEVLDGADQGAGNSYEETVQAVIGSQPCIATRAFAHSTNIDNYDPGTVKAFNRRAFNATIDKMRRSFRLLPR
ncbi:MAG: hypothetical protein JSR55_00620 [Proteobacteria bacterium]|nr:hypothetical protein [Pseudomonadota bacterium]